MTHSTKILKYLIYVIYKETDSEDDYVNRYAKIIRAGIYTSDGLANHIIGRFYVFIIVKPK